MRSVDEWGACLFQKGLPLNEKPKQVVRERRKNVGTAELQRFGSHASEFSCRSFHRFGGSRAMRFSVNLVPLQPVPVLSHFFVYFSLY